MCGVTWPGLRICLRSLHADGDTVPASHVLTISVLNMCAGLGPGGWKCSGFASWEASAAQHRSQTLWLPLSRTIQLKPDFLHVIFTSTKETSSKWINKSSFPCAGFTCCTAAPRHRLHLPGLSLHLWETPTGVFSLFFLPRALLSCWGNRAFTKTTLQLAPKVQIKKK